MSDAGAFFIKMGDTSPSLLFDLLPSTVDLTGATVRFSMRTRAGTVVVSRASAAIVTATGTPRVRYDWQPGNTATPGLHEAEFEVTYAGGAVETFPNFGFIAVQVSGDVA